MSREWVGVGGGEGKEYWEIDVCLRIETKKNNKIGVSFHKWRAYREIDTPSWIKIRIEELKS